MATQISKKRKFREFICNFLNDAGIDYLLFQCNVLNMEAWNRACYGVLRFIMESQAKGCEVVVSGKLRGQCSKSMKFVDGLMIHSSDQINDCGYHCQACTA